MMDTFGVAPWSDVQLHVFCIHLFQVSVTVEVYCAPYSDENEITWGYVAAKAVRKCLQIGLLGCELLKGIAGSSIVGLQNRVSLHVHAAEDRIERLRFHSNGYDLAHQYTLVLEGPLMKLSDEDIVFMFLTWIDHPKQLLSLMLTCKRFLRLFRHDVVWRRLLDYPFPSLWQGCGAQEISERDYWRALAEEQGLSAMQEFKLRLTSHRASRMRFFYGTILSYESAVSPQKVLAAQDQTLVRGLFSWFQGLLTPKTEETRFVVPIVTLQGEDGKRLMRQLHFIVPRSATRFHFSPAAKSQALVRGGVRIDHEEAPRGSRSRVQRLQDPGTFIEKTAEGIVYRRLGDTRLSFIQLSSESICSAYGRWARSELRDFIQVKAMGLVLAVRALEDDDWLDIKQALPRVLQALEKTCPQSLPVLVTVAVCDASAVPLVTEILRPIMDKAHWSTWYLQPYDAHAPESDLTKGALAGWNWLLRTVSRLRR